MRLPRGDWFDDVSMSAEYSYFNIVVRQAYLLVGFERRKTCLVQKGVVAAFETVCQILVEGILVLGNEPGDLVDNLSCIVLHSKRVCLNVGGLHQTFVGLP